MDHVAIDLGGRKSQVCVRSSDGKITKETAVVTSELGEWLARRPHSRVVLETCAEAFKVADEARQHGHDVRVVAATLVGALGVGARGVKTDKRDAQLLSAASCRMDLPSVHIPSTASRELKTRAGMREALVRSRTRLINCVRGWLRASALHPRSGASETFAERVRELVPDVPEYVESLLDTIESLTVEIEAADKALTELAKTDATCPRLMSVPGVGPIVAVRYVAAIDDVSRFETAHHLESYVGLTPGERSSSTRQQRTGITKAGSPRTRAMLVQAAWSAWRSRKAASDPMVKWAKEIEKRRGKRVAIIALARKIAGILFALWRDGSFYDPHHTAPASPPEKAGA
jgi:transposase